VAVLLVMVSCSPNIADVEREERCESMMKKASALEREKRFESAIEIYDGILKKDSENALAHLYLGILFHDQKQDYVGAIYHYRKYLELRPESEKAEMIKNRMRLAGVAFAGKITGDDISGGGEDNNTKILALEAENRSLTEELKILLAKVDALTSEKDKAVQEQPQRRYTVKKNDSLRSIADACYGDEDAWVKIYEANKGIIRGPHNIKEGQVLVIP